MAVSVTRRLGGLLFFFGVLAACGGAVAEDANVPSDGGLGGDVAADVGPSHDSSADSAHDSGDAGRVCIAHCTSDYECQSTCPMPPGMGINCCDIPSGVCFAATMGMCPIVVHDAGMD